MTATERFYKGSKDDIISMDDEDVYGDTFAQMSFKEAIDLDLLTDYKIITIDIKKSEIADFIRANDKVQLNDKWKRETDARSLASMLALRKAMKRFNIKNVVSFHSSIEKAKRSKELQEHITNTYNYKAIDTYTVSGKIPTTKRNIIVQEFAKSDSALITNARCLTEGIDVPNIDCIVFADPKQSKVDIVQALGRALRKKEGKDWGYVILPVIYDGDTNEIDNDSFNEIINIVRGLAGNDERIVEYFKDKAEQGKRSSDIITGSSIFSFDSSMLDEKDLANQLQIKIWEKLSKFNWLPFEEAREIVRSLGLKTVNEWSEYCKSGRLPNNIPVGASIVFKDKGWRSWGDFLGTGVISKHKREYMTFEQARTFINNLQLKSRADWDSYRHSRDMLKDIPNFPQVTYKDNGWQSWGNWLGSGRIAYNLINYQDFKTARLFVHKLKLQNQKQWGEYTKSGKKPFDIPSNPQNTYQNKGWISLQDWIGTSFLNFTEARHFSRSLKLKSINDWKRYYQKNKPKNTPKTPDKVYSKTGEWQGWNDFLDINIEYRHPDSYRPFVDSRKYARKLKLTNTEAWRQFCKSGKKPNDIPKRPERIYKNNGWKGMGDFLGTGFVCPREREYMNFKSAKKYVSALQLKSYKDWMKYSRSGEKPNDIPSTADRVYSKTGEWQGWNDFLGSDKLSNKEKYLIWLDFKKAREVVRTLNLKSQNDFRSIRRENKLLLNIPANPDRTYKNKGWKGWKDFLGKE